MYEITRKKLRGRILVCAIVAVAIFSLVPSIQGTTTAPTEFANWAGWRDYIFHTPAPGSGCFTATYASTAWQPTHCVTAPLLPLTVGNGHDEVAQAPSPTIGSSFGSFQSISGLTSEEDSVYGTNYYGLQDNTNFFTTTTTYTGGKSTTGWEQFVFINDPGASTGYLFMQYWLINYQSQYGTCPSTGPPQGTGWMEYAGSCYANGPSTNVPLEAVTNLGNLMLKGYANFNSNDEDMFCISGGGCYDVATTYQVLNLYQYWQDAEFNVFGYCCGDEANFNAGTSITVVNTLEDQSGNAIVPSCVITGYTGETNNLNLGSCSPNSNGQIVFTESNGSSATQTLITNVASGSGSVSPSCPGPTGCQEQVGSSISVSATPSVNWQFSSWSISGASCSGGSSSNPCTFTMPNNAVTVSATFISQQQVTMTVSYAVVGGGSPSAPVFNYVLNGAAQSLTLTRNPKPVTVDAGTTWSVTPNPLGGSSSSQRWYSSQTLTGAASSTTIVFTFQHQYYLTMVANGPGTVTPSSGWYNSGGKVTITATANSGHKFNSWTGTGTGSYSGTSATHSITMNSAITETANFS